MKALKIGFIKKNEIYVISCLVLLFSASASAYLIENDGPSLRDIYEQKITETEEGWALELQESADRNLEIQATEASTSGAAEFNVDFLSIITENPQTPAQTCEDIGGVWDDQAQSCTSGTSIYELMESQSICEEELGFNWVDGSCVVPENKIDDEGYINYDPEELCSLLGFTWNGSLCEP